MQGTHKSQAESFLRLSRTSLERKKFEGERHEYAGLFQELELLDPAWVHDSVSAGVKKERGGRYLSQWGGPNSDIATTCPRTASDREGTLHDPQYDSASDSRAGSPVCLR